MSTAGMMIRSQSSWPAAHTNTMKTPVNQSHTHNSHRAVHLSKVALRFPRAKQAVTLKIFRAPAVVNDYDAKRASILCVLHFCEKRHLEQTVTRQAHAMISAHVVRLPRCNTHVHCHGSTTRWCRPQPSAAGSCHHWEHQGSVHCRCETPLERSGTPTCRLQEAPVCSSRQRSETAQQNNERTVRPL
jgi:hypothetical protein